MKRVCIVRRGYYPIFPHVRRDAETLRDTGSKVDVVCMRGPGQKTRESIDGVEVYRIPMGRTRKGPLSYIFEYCLFFLLTFVWLTALSLRHRYDAIEVNTMPDFLVFAALIPKLMGSKIVLYLFECMPELFEDTYKIPPTHPMVRMLRFVESRASRFADHVIYCGPGYRAIQEPRVGKPIKGTVVLNVPDEEVFYPRSLASQNGGSDKNRPFRVITHGSLLEKYGVQTLVRAVPALRESIPDLEVFVAGDGEYRQALEDESARLGVQDIVRFTGSLSAEDLADLISECDVGIVAIQHPYMLPSKLFEYMAMQTPVISSSIEFIRDFCNDGEVLLFAPDDDAELAQRINWMYQNAAERSNQVGRANSLY